MTPFAFSFDYSNFYQIYCIQKKNKSKHFLIKFLIFILLYCNFMLQFFYRCKNMFLCIYFLLCNTFSLHKKYIVKEVLNLKKGKYKILIIKGKTNEYIK